MFVLNYNKIIMYINNCKKWELTTHRFKFTTIMIRKSSSQLVISTTGICICIRTGTIDILYVVQ